MEPDTVTDPNLRGLKHVISMDVVGILYPDTVTDPNLRGLKLF